MLAHAAVPSGLTLTPETSFNAAAGGRARPALAQRRNAPPSPRLAHESAEQGAQNGKFSVPTQPIDTAQSHRISVLFEEK